MKKLGENILALLKKKEAEWKREPFALLPAFVVIFSFDVFY